MTSAAQHLGKDAAPFGVDQAALDMLMGAADFPLIRISAPIGAASTAIGRLIARVRLPHIAIRRALAHDAAERIVLLVTRESIGAVLLHRIGIFFAPGIASLLSIDRYRYISHTHCNSGTRRYR